MFSRLIEKWTNLFSRQKDWLFSKLVDPLPEWITPNNLSLFRIALTIPILLFLVKNLYRPALFIFLLATISDAIDGTLARRKNQITEIGKILDPVGDKVVFVLPFIYVAAKHFSLALFITIPLLEFTLLAIALFVKPSLIYYKRKIKSGANIFGKIKMILECGAMYIFLWVNDPSNVPINAFVQIILWLAAVLASLSIIGHLVRKSHKDLSRP